MTRIPDFGKVELGAINRTDDRSQAPVELIKPGTAASLDDFALRPEVARALAEKKGGES